jgi:hypothetical protein
MNAFANTYHYNRPLTARLQYSGTRSNPSWDALRNATT